MAFSTKVPDKAIRVSFYDKDGTRVDNVTKKQAKEVALRNPGIKFYFQDKNGLQRELNIEQVLELIPEKDLISDTALSRSVGSVPGTGGCPTAPQPCGPPKVQFFGGEGVGAMANAVISPVSSGVMAFDVVNQGKEYKTTPFATLDDECGKGSGSSLKVIMEPTGKKDPTTGEDILKVKNVYIDAPGDGYASNFDGSLGGNGRTWKEADEGYVETKDGNYYTVPDDRQPPGLGPGDTWYPPYSAPIEVPDDFQPGDDLTPIISPTPVAPIAPPISLPSVNPPSPPQLPSSPTYKVLICLDDVVIDDPGFNYKPGDTIRIIPDNGSVLEPVINQRGEVTSVNIVSKGCGFNDLPKIIVDSPTGFNAVIKPILNVTRIINEQDLLEVPPDVQLVSVVDCVGIVPPKKEFDRVPR